MWETNWEPIRPTLTLLFIKLQQLDDGRELASPAPPIRAHYKNFTTTLQRFGNARRAPGLTHHMQRKAIVRLGVILFSVSMLAGYVVYSQLQQSKGPIVPSAPVKPGTNLGTGRLVAPGSKMRVPLLPAPTPAPAAAPVTVRTNSPAVPPAMLFPGSKSARMFDLHPQPVKPEKRVSANN